MIFRHHHTNMQAQGFSLIELLLASSLVTFLLLGSAQLLFHTQQSRSRANNHLNTLRLLSTRLEMLRSCPYDSAELSEGQRSLTIDDKSSHQKYLIEWDIKEVSADLKAITIECSSQSHPLQKTRMLLYLSRSLGF